MDGCVPPGDAIGSTPARPAASNMRWTSARRPRTPRRRARLNRLYRSRSRNAAVESMYVIAAEIDDQLPDRRALELLHRLLEPLARVTAELTGQRQEHAVSRSVDEHTELHARRLVWARPFLASSPSGESNTRSARALRPVRRRARPRHDPRTTASLTTLSSRKVIRWAIRAWTATPLLRAHALDPHERHDLVAGVEHLLRDVAEVAEDPLRVGPQLAHPVMSPVDAAARARERCRCAIRCSGSNDLERCVHIVRVERLVAATHQLEAFGAHRVPQRLQRVVAVAIRRPCRPPCRRGSSRRARS